MSSRVLFGWGVVACLAVLAACGSSQYPHATPADVAKAQKHRAGVTLDDLEKGRSLYLSRCGGCHQLIDPKSVAADQWPHEVEQMREQANLDAKQVDLLVTYLVTQSTPP